MTLDTFVGRLNLMGIVGNVNLNIEIGKRGNGSFKLTTNDTHAVHAVELTANRYGLRYLLTTTDENTQVITVRGFSKAA